MTTTPKKVGRPRLYTSNAAKQAAYRRRKQEKQRENLIKALRIRQFDAWELMGLTIRELKRWKRARGTGRERYQTGIT